MSSKHPAVRPDNALLSVEEAIEKYSTASKSEPTAEHFFELGAAYYIARRWQDALSAFQKAVDLDPKQAVAYYYIGVLSAALGNREQANAALEKLLNTSSNRMLQDQGRARIPNISSPEQLGGS
jgi:tetratricopeptide (TPR) repeat protein